MRALPATLLDGLGLTTGARVVLTLERGRLVVHPAARPSDTLDDPSMQRAPTAD